MTAHQQLAALVADLSGSGKDLAWLAREVLALVGRAGGFVLPGPGGPGDLFGLSPRLLRPFLAALAKAAADASGAEFDPYHGRYLVERHGEDGSPVLLLVTVENTPGVQCLDIRPAGASHVNSLTAPRSRTGASSSAG